MALGRTAWVHDGRGPRPGSLAKGSSKKTVLLPDDSVPARVHPTELGSDVEVNAARKTAGLEYLMMSMYEYTYSNSKFGILLTGARAFVW